MNGGGKPFRVKPRISDDETRQNMLALLALVEQGLDSPTTEKGELLRELGRFDEAIAATGIDGDYKEQADLIAGFARSGDAVV